MVSRERALQIAEEALVGRFPAADAAFAAGSMVRGEGTAFSDIDLVVLHRQVDRAWRESFLVAGTPVEAFVHDGATLEWFLNKETNAGRAALLGMLVEGRIIGPRQADAAQWKQRAVARLAAGPPALSQERIDDLRYAVTDKIDDLRGVRPAPELMAVGVALYDPLAELVLRTRGSWWGRAKWIPRLLMRVDPELARRFTAAFEALFKHGDPKPLIVLAERELSPLGGLLFDGFRRDAPAVSTARDQPECTRPARTGDLHAD
jgi:predicted nucleotidyltransferase